MVKLPLCFGLLGKVLFSLDASAIKFYQCVFVSLIIFLQFIVPVFIVIKSSFHSFPLAKKPQKFSKCFVLLLSQVILQPA